jgi:hypothetical protein
LEVDLASIGLTFTKTSSYCFTLPSNVTVITLLQLNGPVLHAPLLLSESEAIAEAAMGDLFRIINKPEFLMISHPYIQHAPILSNLLSILNKLSQKKSKNGIKKAALPMDILRALLRPQWLSKCLQTDPELLNTLLLMICPKPSRIFRGNMDLKVGIVESLKEVVLHSRQASSLLGNICTLLNLSVKTLLENFVDRGDDVGEKDSKKNESDFSSAAPGDERLIVALIRLLMYYDPKYIPWMIEKRVVLPQLTTLLAKAASSLHSSTCGQALECLKYIGKDQLALNSEQNASLHDSIHKLASEANDPLLHVAAVKVLELLFSSSLPSFGSLDMVIANFKRERDFKARVPLLNFLKTKLEQITSPSERRSILLRLLDPRPIDKDFTNELTSSSAAQSSVPLKSSQPSFAPNEIDWITKEFQATATVTWEQHLQTDFVQIVSACLQEPAFPVETSQLLVDVVDKAISSISLPNLEGEDKQLPKCIWTGFCLTQPDMELDEEGKQFLDSQILSNLVYHIADSRRALDAERLQNVLRYLWLRPVVAKRLVELDPLFIDRAIDITLKFVDYGVLLPATLHKIICSLAILLFEVSTDRNYNFVEDLQSPKPASSSSLPDHHSTSEITPTSDITNTAGRIWNAYTYLTTMTKLATITQPRCIILNDPTVYSIRPIWATICSRLINLASSVFCSSKDVLGDATSIATSNGSSPLDTIETSANTRLISMENLESVLLMHLRMWQENIGSKFSDAVLGANLLTHFSKLVESDQELASNLYSLASIIPRQLPDLNLTDVPLLPLHPHLVPLCTCEQDQPKDTTTATSSNDSSSESSATKDPRLRHGSAIEPFRQLTRFVLLMCQISRKSDSNRNLDIWLKYMGELSKRGGGWAFHSLVEEIADLWLANRTEHAALVSSLPQSVLESFVIWQTERKQLQERQQVDSASVDLTATQTDATDDPSSSAYDSVDIKSLSADHDDSDPMEKVNPRFVY